MRIIYKCWWLPTHINAITLPECVLVRRWQLTATQYKHEMEHIKQWRRWLYIGFLPAYFIGFIIGYFRSRKLYLGDGPWWAGAYLYNPFEVEARDGEH